MRQSIRALGWAITISMLLLFTFLVTSVYSLVQTILMNQGISLSNEPQVSFSNGTLTLSFTLSVNNTGYYDISDLNVTTVLMDSKGMIISENSTFIDRITKGLATTKQHCLSINLVDILSNVTNLTRDTEFKMEISVGLKYAEALTFQLAMTNISYPWGAPVHNFSLNITDPPKSNGTHLLLKTLVEFENHAFFDISGIIHLDIYNSDGGYVGSGNKTVHVEAAHGYSSLEDIVIYPVNLSNFTSSGYVVVSFEIPMFGKFEMGRIDYG